MSTPFDALEVETSDSKSTKRSNAPEGVGIPSYGDIQRLYDARFKEERLKWNRTLSERLQSLISNFAAGHQELIQMKVTKHSHYLERWFRELFADPEFEASIGETKVLGSHEKHRFKSLYITLPETIGERK